MVGSEVETVLFASQDVIDVMVLAGAHMGHVGRVVSYVSCGSRGLICVMCVARSDTAVVLTRFHLVRRGLLISYLPRASPSAPFATPYPVSPCCD